MCSTQSPNDLSSRISRIRWHSYLPAEGTRLSLSFGKLPVQPLGLPARSSLHGPCFQSRVQFQWGLGPLNPSHKDSRPQFLCAKKQHVVFYIETIRALTPSQQPLFQASKLFIRRCQNINNLAILGGHGPSHTIWGIKRNHARSGYDPSISNHYQNQWYLNMYLRHLHTSTLPNPVHLKDISAIFAIRRSPPTLPSRIICLSLSLPWPMEWL
jgi:hypothetical protein